MKFEKIAFIKTPVGYSDWITSHMMCPTPYITDQNIRIYCGFLDEFGISRIGWIEIDIHNPENILKVSKKPTLDIGRPGTFDDNGVVPSCMIDISGQKYLYYFGFQLVEKVRYLMFGNVATEGKRLYEYPIFNRDRNSLFVKSAPFVFKYNNASFYECFYTSSNEFITINNKIIPKYNIRKSFIFNYDYPDVQSTIVVDFKDDKEFGIGRPYVIEHNNKVYLFYSTRSTDKKYSIGYSITDRWNKFNRYDDNLEILNKDNGSCNNDISYPAVIKINNSYYMFYNEGCFGKDGIAVAKLISWN